ncbi:MAG: hypothetical protein J6T63_03425 [Bacteroidales bacterium]|nr:hypothetical protein [Bacteroidales bacterium]
MKKNLFLIVCAVALVLGFSSCGSKDYVLKPSTTQISGPLGNCYKVVDKEFKCKYDEGNVFSPYMITVELERIDGEFPSSIFAIGYEPFGHSGSGVYGNYGFGIEIRDEDDNVVYNCAATAAGLSGPYSSDDVMAFRSLNPGETSIIRWSEDLSKKEIKGNNLTFKITSAVD